MIHCTSGKFGCITKQHGTFECLSENFKCDGTVDCKDSSDESFCTNCSQALWTCHTKTANGTFKCISKDWLCDRVKDCQDGSDERDCNTTGFADIPVEEILATNVKLGVPPRHGLKTTPGHTANKSYDQHESLTAILSSPHGIALVAVVAVLGLVILIAGTVMIIRFRKAAKQAKKISKSGITIESENVGGVERNEYEDIDALRRDITGPRDCEEPEDAKYADINSSFIANQYQALSKTPTTLYAGYCSLQKDQLKNSCILDTIVLDQSTTSGKRNSAYAAVSTLTRNKMRSNEKQIAAFSLPESVLNDSGLVTRENNIGHFIRDNLQTDECDSQFGTRDKSPNNYLHPVYTCTSQTRYEMPSNGYLHPVYYK